MTDQTTETARALLYRHGLPEDVIDGALCLHARELAAVQRAAIAKTDDPVFYEGEAGWLVNVIEPDTTPATPLPMPADEARMRLLQALDAPYCQALGYTPEGLLAAYEASRAQTVDRAALRDPITQALAVAEGWQFADGSDLYDLPERERMRYRDSTDAVLAVLPATPGRAEYDVLVAEADRLRREGAALHARAEGIDKQLAALQKQVAAPVDRAAVLREAADRIDNEELPPDYVDMFDNGARWAAKLLRRVADETAATETPWPTQQRWRIELFDYLAEEWSPGGTRWPTREQAMERIQLMREKAPMWKDGTPTQRRVIRETTTYTVESEPAAGARQDGAHPGGAE